MCVREANDAGSLKQKAKMIRRRSIWWNRIDLHSQSWKAALQQEEIALGFVGVIDIGRLLDFDDELEWPRFCASVRLC